MQAGSPNHCKLRRLRAGVVSVAGKGPLSAGQVRDEKTNVCEPPLTHRSAYGHAVLRMSPRTAMPVWMARWLLLPKPSTKLRRVRGVVGAVGAHPVQSDRAGPGCLDHVLFGGSRG